MKNRLFTLGKVFVSRLGLYKPARFLYNLTSMSGATRTAEINGIICTFRTPTRTIAEHVETLTGEREILRHFLQQVRPDDVVWDVGAGFGLYTLFAGNLMKQGMVYAFEPEPRTRALLERNLRLNRISRVEILRFALGDADSVVTMYQSDSPNVGTHALVQRTDFRLKARGITVDQRRGDSILQEGMALPPHMLKIDVEGAECRVLAGMSSMLSHPSLRSVYCEVHPRVLQIFGDSPSDVERLITNAGLAIIERHERGTEYHIVSVRHS